jgi:hypothetical protein
LGLFGIVLEDLPDLADGAVDAVVHIEEGVLPPDAFGDLFPGDKLARRSTRSRRISSGMRSSFTRRPARRKLVRCAVQLKVLAEANG